MNTISPYPSQEAASAPMRKAIKPHSSESVKPRVWGLAWPEWIVLTLYSTIALITQHYHEPWADEAQSWLIARDLSFLKMLAQVKYEGTPPLWHALLWVVIRLHLPYSQIGLVSVAIMTAAAYIWLRYAPLPRVICLLVPFTFFLQYQYAVVARSYCLTVLLAFAVAAAWPQRKKHLRAIGVLLALLCQTNMFGFALAASLSAVLWLGLYIDRRRTLILPGERMQLWTATLLVIASACIAAWLAHSPPDISFLGPSNFGVPLAFLWPVLVLKTKLVLFMVCGSVELGVLLLLVLPAWLAECRQRLAILPFLVILATISCMYSMSWHQGMVVLALLVTVWLGFPATHTPQSKRWTWVIAAVLLFCVIIQVRWGALAVYRDIHGPYSGAKAAAEYIRPQVGTRPIMGAHYHSISLLPYFDHNIYANQPAGHSYWAWSVNDPSEFNVTAKRDSGPATVVVAWVMPKDRYVVSYLLTQRFRMTRRFCGQMFMRDSYVEPSCFDIYERD